MNAASEPLSDQHDAGSQRFGPFRVAAAAAEVDAFRRETGWAGLSGEMQALQPVPHTFPMRWLSAPDIRAAVEAKLTSVGGVAFHESQSFNYLRPLDTDQDYLMSLDIDHQETPPRLILRAAITSMSNEPCLNIETILRIVSAAGAAA
jgi:hypothetical protein